MSLTSLKDAYISAKSLLVKLKARNAKLFDQCRGWRVARLVQLLNGFTARIGYKTVQEVPQREATPLYPRSPLRARRGETLRLLDHRELREAHRLHASNGILFIMRARYESLLRAIRIVLHARLVEMLEMLEVLEASGGAVPEIKAQHPEAAGLTERALGYWEQAGAQALARQHTRRRMWQIWCDFAA